MTTTSWDESCSKRPNPAALPLTATLPPVSRKGRTTLQYFPKTVNKSKKSPLTCQVSLLILLPPVRLPSPSSQACPALLNADPDAAMGGTGGAAFG